MGTIVGDRGALAGIRSEVRIRAAAPGRPVLRQGAAAAVLLLMAAPVVGLGLALHAMSLQLRCLDGLRTEVRALRTQVDAQPDWTAIARKVEPSVFTIETSYGLGSGWVPHARQAGAARVADFHVIPMAWTRGTVTAAVH